ncbi:cytochrome p450 [Trichoderma cornu-damae]|uniref:Cytochrome p450 n=1 Tax=Trichoderma cornu-damae TaxID=654480 RepID=A0A9P8QDL7_9HYPO|nr:cytochrome p450 [Trichoderma cornu-damae]
MAGETELIDSLTAEQAHAILKYLCDDASIASKVSAYATELKAEPRLTAICVQCDLPFDPSRNTYKKCRYHSGDMEVDWDGDCWADHDEDCHGAIDTEEMREEHPSGFFWNCCDRSGEQEGCRLGRHEADPSKSKRGMGYGSETDEGDQRVEEEDDDDDDDEGDGGDEDGEDDEDGGTDSRPVKKQKLSV